MIRERLLIDTVFVQGLINRRDQHHALVRSFVSRMEVAEVWITEAILMEIANALSAIDRQGAADFIRGCYNTPNMNVVAVDSPLFMRGLDLYEDRPDKEWSLTDCISFLVMKDKGLAEALTTDHHYRQAGFLPLLLDAP